MSTAEYVQICVGGALLAFMLIGGLLASISERRRYNGGICAKNGLPWECFDTDSQGGRMYKAGNEYLDVSYPGID